MDLFLRNIDARLQRRCFDRCVYFALLLMLQAVASPGNLLEPPFADTPLIDNTLAVRTGLDALQCVLHLSLTWSSPCPQG